MCEHPHREPSYRGCTEPPARRTYGGGRVRKYHQQWEISELPAAPHTACHATISGTCQESSLVLSFHLKEKWGGGGGGGPSWKRNINVMPIHIMSEYWGPGGPEAACTNKCLFIHALSISSKNTNAHRESSAIPRSWLNFFFNCPFILTALSSPSEFLKKISDGTFLSSKIPKLKDDETARDGTMSLAWGETHNVAGNHRSNTVQSLNQVKAWR